MIVFTSWTGDLTGYTNPATLLVDGQKAITAQYVYGDPSPPPTPDPGSSPPPPAYYLTIQADDTYSTDITVTVNPPGNTTQYPISYTYTSPTTVTIKANDYINMSGGSKPFWNWSGDLTGSTNPATLLVDGVKSVTAVYGGDIPSIPPTPDPTAVPTSVAQTPPPTPEPATPSPATPPPSTTADAGLTPVPSPPICNFMIADANGSGAVDIIDALVVAQYYVGTSPSTFQLCAADVNKDGVVDIVDALRIAQCYVGLISCNF
jgi:hypothetical protein